MKYEELHAIANAIIDSNNKLIYLNTIIVLISIASVFFVALFKKSGELSAIKLAFDDIKKQNRIITSETESIKRQLEKGTIEYQIKLSKYHEKKIDAIEEIHSKLAELLICSRNILLATDSADFSEFRNAIAEFRSIFEAKKIWIDASIGKEIEEFSIEIDSQVLKYEGAMNVLKLPGLNEIIGDRLYDTHQDFYKFTLNGSKILNEKLEESLRDYLYPKSE